MCRIFGELLILAGMAMTAVAQPLQVDVTGRFSGTLNIQQSFQNVPLSSGATFQQVYPVDIPMELCLKRLDNGFAVGLMTARNSLLIPGDIYVRGNMREDAPETVRRQFITAIYYPPKSKGFVNNPNPYDFAITRDILITIEPYTEKGNNDPSLAMLSGSYEERIAGLTQLPIYVRGRFQLFRNRDEITFGTAGGSDFTIPLGSISGISTLAGSALSGVRVVAVPVALPEIINPITQAQGVQMFLSAPMSTTNDFDQRFADAGKWIDVSTESAPAISTKSQVAAGATQATFGVSNAQGDYTIDNLPTWRLYRIYADKPGYQFSPTFAEIFVRGDEQGIDFSATRDSSSDQDNPRFIAYPDEGISPLDVSVMDLSSGGVDPIWVWGDGSPQESVNACQEPVRHTYVRPGFYTIELSRHFNGTRRTFVRQIRVGPSSGQSVHVFPTIISFAGRNLMGSQSLLSFSICVPEDNQIFDSDSSRVYGGFWNEF